MKEDDTYTHVEILKLLKEKNIEVSESIVWFLIINGFKLISPIEAHELTQNQKLARVDGEKNINILIGILLYLQMKVHSNEEKEKRRDDIKTVKNITNIWSYVKKVKVWEGKNRQNIIENLHKYNGFWLLLCRNFKLQTFWN